MAGVDLDTRVTFVDEDVYAALVEYRDNEDLSSFEAAVKLLLDEASERAHVLQNKNRKKRKKESNLRS